MVWVVLLFLFEAVVISMPQIAVWYNPDLSEKAVTYVADASSKIVLWLIITILITALGQTWSRFRWVRTPMYGVAAYSILESYLRILCRMHFPLTGPPNTHDKSLCHAAGYYTWDVSTISFFVFSLWLADIGMQFVRGRRRN